MMATLSRSELLALYRRTLRAAAVFPSKNRAGLAREIRDEWRRNAAMPPGPARDAQHKLAADSLRQLDAYVGAADPGRPDAGVALGAGAGPAELRPGGEGVKALLWWSVCGALW